MTRDFDATRRRITALRLTAQAIAAPIVGEPVDVVRHLLAMQAQDFAGAKWSVGLRLGNTTDVAIEAALADGSIVRSWPMRGTLHFVASEDLRWIIGLTGERTIRAAASRHRQLGLDDADFARARRIAETVLSDGPRARSSLLAAFETGGLSTAGQRGAHLLVWLAASRVTVFGPVAGKQQSFALFENWIRESRDLGGDEALAEFVLRYLRSHGPATIRDFAWWSSLTLTDARRGLEIAAGSLEREGDLYRRADLEPATAAVHALPGFDEYLLGYQDRTAPLHLDHFPRIVPGNNGMFMPTIVVDGEVVGTWKRTLASREVVVTPVPFGSLTMAQAKGFAAASARYGSFVGKPARVTPAE
ncbi:winged helix DNA-binding domain-containing protein [soil metagenome]